MSQQDHPQEDTAVARRVSEQSPPNVEIQKEQTIVADLPKEEEIPKAKSDSVGREVGGWRWAITCLVVYATCFLYGLDTTIAADVQGPVLERFGHAEQLAWVGAGFPLGSVCVILLFGTLYNNFDKKVVYLSTLVVFEAGSALCGAAPSMTALIVGRVVAGAGGSGIFLGSLHYFTDLPTVKERGFYVALSGVVWGLGAVLGPVVGGAFAESPATWRWAFYINLVIGAASAPAFFFSMPSIHPVTGVSIRDRLKPLDFIGFILGASVYVTFLLALIMAGGQWPWDDGRTLATFVVFGVVLILYVLQQYFAVLTTPAHRAFPGHLLRDRTQVLLYIVTASSSTSLFVVVYFIPIYFQFVNNDSALMAAVRLLPYVVILVTVNQLAGSLLHLLNFYMVIYVTSGVFMVIGGALLMVYLDPTSTTGTIYGLTVIVAVATGLTQLTGYIVASLTLKPEDIGAGLALQNSSQIGGAAICLAIAGQIFQSTAVRKLTVALAGNGFSSQEIRGLVAGTQSPLFQTLTDELRLKAVRAVTEAMQTTFALVAVAGATMLIAACCMKRERVTGAAPVAGA
ncbi:hypothetical protein B0A52_00085 [Exophiala mesophila]|uniref:Major facilitator superfamily (MFS) profile domain-containing protein n=1 Tax=Exophiala mesophila TaxID=212818 RepID=A0A438NJ17_EXOME|nr:hypothetical protein B0A52_00085 [Exophiala mesophila]